MAVIYQIRNRQTGEVSVGSTTNLTARWGNHLAWLRTGRHHRLLQQAWDTYGPDAFRAEPVLSVLPGTDARLLEQQVDDQCMAFGIGLDHLRRPGPAPLDPKPGVWQPADGDPTPDEIARVMAYLARKANAPTTRVGPQCGKTFTSPRGRTWCSPGCKANAWHTQQGQARRG